MIIQEKHKTALTATPCDIKQLESQIRTLKGGFDLVFDFVEDFEQGLKDDLSKKRDAVEKIKIACTSHGIDKAKLIDLNIYCSAEFYYELEKFDKLKRVNESTLRSYTSERLKGILLSIAKAIVESGSKSFARQFIESASKVAADKIVDVTEDKIVEAVLGSEGKQVFDRLKDIADMIKKIKGRDE